MKHFLHILCPDLKNKLFMHDEAHLQLNGDTNRQHYFAGLQKLLANV